jgi:hypothetical protein
MSSVQTYSARRHYLNALTAKLGGHTPTEWAKLLRGAQRDVPRIGRRPSATPTPRAAAKPVPNVAAVKAKAARSRRLRMAEAEAAMPAPRRKPSPPLALEACTSLTLGGSLFDRAPVIYAADGGAPASGAARRVNARPTRRQVAAMLRRVDAAASW